MEPESVVRDCFEALEAKQFEDAASYLSDDFVFSDPVPQPIGKKEFLKHQSELITAMPDWRFNLHNFRTQGDTVSLVVQITGTHAGTLPAFMPGMMALPPTGKRVSLPEEPCRATVRNGKITRFEVEQVPGGGIPGILQQLGIPIRI